MNETRETIQCPRCKGFGANFEDALKDHDCTLCDGAGEVIPLDSFNGKYERVISGEIVYW